MMAAVTSKAQFNFSRNFVMKDIFSKTVSVLFTS